MGSYEVAALEAQISALDRETVQRVVRLVFECSASLDLALLAVQDADRAAIGCETKRPTAWRGFGGVRSFIGARS